MKKRTSVGLFDRIVSCLTYLSAGWVGMIVLVLFYFKKRKPSIFLQYNVFQSIFISLLFFVIGMTLGLIFKMLSFIPFLDYLVAQVSFIFNVPVIFNYSIIQAFTTCLILYMAILSAMGKYPRVYWVSRRIIDRAVK